VLSHGECVGSGRCVGRPGLGRDAGCHLVQDSTALSEIVVGTVAQLVIGALFVHTELGGKTSWISFLAGTGAIVLTFLAGAELDPQILRTKWKEATIVGLVGFFGPFLGCTAVAHYLLHWSGRASWLAGVALSTTSVAVVYAVMLELGFNVTDFGKAVLAACFINDLGTVIALGMIFSPFTIKTLIFVVVSMVVFAVLPFLTPRFFRKYGGRVSELEAKYLLFLLFAMGDWRSGRAAKQSCQPTSSVWCWREPWERNTL
jgi:glutathione-regulated potassium-efflux system ancillary protein KefC